MIPGPGPWEAIVRENALRDRPRGHLLVELVDILPGQRIEARPIFGSNEDAIPAVGRGVAVMFGQFGARYSTQTCWWLGRTTVAPDDGTGVTELSAAAQEPAPGFPGGRGTHKATTSDWEAQGGPKARELAEPAPLMTGEYPKIQVHETPGGIRAVRDDTEGARRIDETVGVHAHERTEDGRDVRRCTVSFDLVLDRAARIVEGDDDTVIAGTETRTVEGDAAKAVDGRTFYRGAGGARIDLGSLRLSVDMPPGGPDEDGEDPVQGLALTSLGAVLLRVASAFGVEARNASVSGLEDASVSGGDVTIEATGLESVTPVDAAAMLLGGLNERKGKLSLRGVTIELSLPALAPSLKAPVAVRVAGDVVEVVQATASGLAEKSTMAPLLVSALGLEALKKLANEGTLISAAPALATAFSTGQITLAEGFRTS